MIRVCDALTMASYNAYRLLYGPPDILAFSRELEMEMEVLLGSHTHFCELFEILEVFESTQFQDPPDAWSNRWSLALYYQPGRTECSDEFLS